MFLGVQTMPKLKLGIMQFRVCCVPASLRLPDAGDMHAYVISLLASKPCLLAVLTAFLHNTGREIRIRGKQYHDSIFMADSQGIKPDFINLHKAYGGRHARPQTIQPWLLYKVSTSIFSLSYHLRPQKCNLSSFSFKMLISHLYLPDLPHSAEYIPWWRLASTYGRKFYI